MTSSLKYSQEVVTIMSVGLGEMIPVSDQLKSRGLIDWLNSFLGVATEIVRDHGGTILQCPMGDLMAAWSGVGTNASRACRAATVLAEQIAIMNERADRQGYPKRKVSIGLSTGVCAVQVCAREYIGAMGDAVNAAFRLQRKARQLGVMILADRTVTELCPHGGFEEVEPGVSVVICR